MIVVEMTMDCPVWYFRLPEGQTSSVVFCIPYIPIAAQQEYILQLHGSMTNPTTCFGEVLEDSVQELRPILWRVLLYI